MKRCVTLTKPESVQRKQKNILFLHLFVLVIVVLFPHDVTA